ncbi:AI-2E family transporter [Algoriphagus sp. AGSA1]|nr:AI-2E family transporter [Algoriphagus sp. AGSA1]
MASWLENNRIPRGLSIIFSIALITILVIGVVYLFSKQMAGLLKDFPEITSALNSRLEQYQDYLNREFGLGIEYAQALENVGSMVNPEKFTGFVLTTGKTLAFIGIVPLYIFLLMYYKDFFNEFLTKLNESKNQNSILEWSKDSSLLIQAYLTGILKVTAVVAVMAGIFFYVIGVKYFILFALFVAVMNLIPYIGVLFSSIVSILYVFLTTDSIMLPFLTMLVLWAIQLLENNIITPVVVGAEVKLNALVVLLAILLGGWIWGVSGMVLFIPMLGILKLQLEKSERHKALAYLLGDKIPVREKRENLWKIVLRKMKGNDPKGN